MNLILTCSVLRSVILFVCMFVNFIFFSFDKSRNESTEQLRENVAMFNRSLRKESQKLA